ncbi:S8 family peptidase [Orenia marismortui]|uniref:Subtilase family protein n=1 Tax=Orenia marismortui TaxID=46469 RepID=A0A4R8HG36_9FIRM|nr:S8 family peptidase [Orenia marismortui]TDX59196.1 subtilase family protein [Orenia marismortui]
MNLFRRIIITLTILSLVLIIAGCSDILDDDSGFNGIQGHITLSNIKIDNSTSITKQSTQISNEKMIRGIDSSSKQEYVKDEIIISFKESADIKQILKKYKLIEKKNIEELNTKLLTGVGTRDIQRIIKELNQEDTIDYAELNRRVKLMAVEPKDPGYMNQKWNYSAISLPEAWALSTGSAKVTVAVIDTGIDLDHPDLKGQLIDGIDMVGDDEDDFPGPDDRNGHGTHVAGIIGATTNNDEGIAGINWNISLMPVKVLPASGKNGNMETISAGIVWAVNRGADIINLSLGASEASKILEEAIEYAYKHNVTVIAASGNYSSDELLYPSQYTQVIGVASIDSYFQLSTFSNYGENLDFVAPGEDIYSTYISKYFRYKYDSGTSMATPHVTGVAALILAKFRAEGENLTPDQIKEELVLTAEDLGESGKDNQYGYGLINAHAALAGAKITQAKVFAGEKLASKIRLKSDLVKVTDNGLYQLSNVEKGNWYIYSWIDLDKPGEEGYDKIDVGDYFGRTSSQVGLGSNTNFEINLITDESFEELEVGN